MTRDGARKLRAIVEMAALSLPNKHAFEAVLLFHDHKPDVAFWDGHLVTTGTRIRWGGKLVAAANDLWATENNNPDNAPALWEHIEYRDGYRVLNCAITASNPVLPGERCWENDVLYENISGTTTVYRPSEYSAAWAKVEM